MKKRYLIIFISIILVIAYCDLMDSLRHFDNILSEMVKLNSAIKTDLNSSLRFSQILKIEN